MFTGIIEEVGTVALTVARTGGCEISVSAPGLFPAMRIGDSLAVNGACLTVTRKQAPAALFFDVSEETLSRTLLGDLNAGDRVNLEPALTLEKPIGGHLVSGHIDGIATLALMTPSGDMVEMTFQVPASLCEGMIEKGSVAIDGISLTIAVLKDTAFTVAVIPHTLRETTLFLKKIGDKFNLETDMIGKYIKRFLSGKKIKTTAEIDRGFLAEHGFLAP
jgi:riboflavin synthase